MTVEQMLEEGLQDSSISSMSRGLSDNRTRELFVVEKDAVGDDKSDQSSSEGDAAPSDSDRYHS